MASPVWRVTARWAGITETPPSLPTESTVDVDYDALIAAIDTVTVIDTAILTFDDVNE